MKSKSVAEAGSEFKRAAVAKGDAREPLPARADHALHAQMARAVWALDDLGAPGAAALEALATDESPLVRSWAAAELLSRGDSRMRPILEELALLPGMVGFDARIVLQQLAKGELKSPFGKREHLR